MDDIQGRMMNLSWQGYYCSQILLTLGLDRLGIENPDLIRAAGGMALGAGKGTGTCGSLTGGTCLIALYAAKGAEGEREDDNLWDMCDELWTWFEDAFGAQYGGVRCDDILADRAPRLQRCGPIVAQTYAKVMEILTEYGIDPTERPGG